MGAWAAGVFDNDTACDWVYSLEEIDDLSLIRSTLGQVLDMGDDYIDSDVAAQGLAACEVIARLKGQWGQRTAYTTTVDRWVEAHPMEVSSELVDQAVAAIDRILTPPSELMDLWQEGDNGGEWRRVVEELRTRVEA